MKILFISSGNSIKQISPFIKSQGKSIVDKGIDLEFFTVKGKGVRGYLKNIKLIREKAKHFDIIHAHYGLIGFLVGISFTKKPLVLSIMGTDICGNFKENGKRTISSYLIMVISQLALFFSKIIIVKSQNLLEYIPSFFKSKTHIIPNGVNFKVFKPMNYILCREKLKFKEGEKVILFLANPNKPNKNYKFIKEAIPYISLPNVRLINPYPITQQEFVAYLNASDVFVLSSFNEGSPNVIKEAMACNCPVVSTNVGDVKSVIGNTDGCFLSSFNTEDLAKQIEKALSFNTRTEGRNDIGHLKSELIANNIVNIYESIN